MNTLFKTLVLTFFALTVSSAYAQVRDIEADKKAILADQDTIDTFKAMGIDMKDVTIEPEQGSPGRYSVCGVTKQEMLQMKFCISMSITTVEVPVNTSTVKYTPPAAENNASDPIKSDQTSKLTPCDVDMIEIPSAKGGSRIRVMEINGEVDFETMKLGSGWYAKDELIISDGIYTVTRKYNSKGIELSETEQRIWTINLADDNSSYTLENAAN